MVIPVCLHACLLAHADRHKHSGRRVRQIRFIRVLINLRERWGEGAKRRKKARERKGEKRVLGSMASPFKSSMPFGRSKWRGSVKVKKGEGAKKGFWVLGSELASGIKLKAIQILVNPRSQIRGIRVLKKERVRNGEGAIKRSGFSVSIRYYVESRYKSVVISVRQICFIRVLINLRER